MASKTPDPFESPGLGSGKAIGFVVKRVGGKVLRTSVNYYTHKEAARLFLKGAELFVKGGTKEAMKIGRIITERHGSTVLRGGDHAAGHWLAKYNRFGLPHIQIDDIEKRHIFYGILGAAMVAAGSSETNACEFSLDVSSVYTDPRPGPSIVNALTATYWAGEDSWWSNADWLNPLELAASAADMARSVDRELEKELVGVTITISKKNGPPLQSYSFDTSGNLVTVGQWNEGDLTAIRADKYFGSIGTGTSDPILSVLAKWVEANR